MLFVLPAVLLVAVLFVAPTVMTAVMSLYRWSLLGAPHFVGLSNYTRALHDKVFGRSLLFTTQYTLVVTIVLLVVGFALALLVRGNRRGSGLVRTVVFAPVVVGFATASYLALWLVDSRIGLIDKLLRDTGLVRPPTSWLGTPGLALMVVVLLVVWKTVGLTMLLLMSGMQAISTDFYEAASVDGAGAFRRFRSITLPLLRPTVAMVLILTVISSYLAFDQFFLLTKSGPDGSTTTVVFRIYRAAFIDFDLGYASALSMILMVVLLALTAVQIRLLNRGADR
jgi:multiple sugar transport system permease protein